MKKYILNLSGILILLMLSLNLFGQKQKVIFDCDLGDDIDDAYALALLIASPELDILGIVMDYGNTPKRAQIACRMLYETGRENIPVVIGRKTADNFSSPLEEAITKFTDMPLLNRKLGINDLFKDEKDLNKDKNTKTAAIALMRSINMVYGDVDKKFYDEHKNEFIELIETYMQEHTGFTINGFMNMMHELKNKSESDSDLLDMAKEQLVNARIELEKVNKELEIALLPKDPNDDKNIYLEIRPAA